jgi:hypothetical protein
MAEMSFSSLFYFFDLDLSQSFYKSERKNINNISFDQVFSEEI